MIPTDLDGPVPPASSWARLVPNQPDPVAAAPRVDRPRGRPRGFVSGSDSDRIVSFLARSQTACSYRAVAAALGIRSDQAAARLSQLHAAGVVARAGKPRQFVYFIEARP